MPIPFGLPHISPSGYPLKPQRGHVMYLGGCENAAIQSSWDRANEQGAIPREFIDSDDTESADYDSADNSVEFETADEEPSE